MLSTAFCGDGGGSVVSTATPDQTCTQQKNPPQRQPASVSNTGWESPHGYAVAEWKGAASSLGATINTVKLHVSNPSNQFLDNELWLSDNANDWVETGYGTFAGGISYTFWADNSTSIGTYYLYVLDKAAVGSTLDYDITGADGQSPQVYVQGVQDCHSFTSSGNLLITRSATSDIGMEIYDSTSGAPHCSSGGLSDPSASYSGLSLDPGLTSSNYTLIDDVSRSITAGMSPSTGAPTSLTTSC
jgi:hypothetical protein